MRRKLAILTSVLSVILLAGAVFFFSWTRLGPLQPTGGLPIPFRLAIPVPHFAQADPKWASDNLGPTSNSLGAEGCAVASAAMVLASYGARTDPGQLNTFLQQYPNGYTDRGWIYWESAAEIDPELASKALPHYEDDASYFLIDVNLLRGNPVIVRVRQPSGMTHFMVICGKEGLEYLVLDPALPPGSRPYRLSQYGSPIEALRFYRKPGES